MCMLCARRNNRFAGSVHCWFHVKQQAYKSMFNYLLTNRIYVAVMAEPFPLVLTGITTAFLAGLVYSTTDHGFQTSGRYRSKEDALWIFLGTILVLGLVNPLIYSFWRSFTSAVDPTTPIGLIMGGGMFLVNESVTHWNHTDQKSVAIYLLSGLLIVV